jgi:hypothetical protein
MLKISRDITQSIAEGPDVNKIAHSQVELEKTLAQSDKISEAVSVALDMASEGFLNSQDYSEKNVDEAVKTIQNPRAEHHVLAHG